MSKYKIKIEKCGDNRYLSVCKLINLYIYKFWREIDRHLIIDDTTIDYYCNKYNCHSNI